MNDQLHLLSDKVVDNIEKIFTLFNIKTTRTNKRFDGPCPVHGGDKYNAFNLYHTGHTCRGNWRCNTNSCHKHFVASPLGFIRGILSHKEYDWSNPGDKEVKFRDTVEFCEKFTGFKVGKLDINLDDIEKIRFADSTQLFQTVRPVVSSKITRELIQKSLKPHGYYIDKGYTKDILYKYDVGFCGVAGKPMFMRMVVPVYDDEHKYMIGCTGRTINPKCEACECYHSVKSPCPPVEFRNIYSKWKHNFDKEYYLYNYWYAKQHILDTGIAVLVESPGNVWRLEEAGIHNSVAMLGDSLSEKQIELLNLAGTIYLVIITDNDKAGEASRKTITEQCEHMFNIKNICITNYNDIGEMPVSEIKQQVLPVIQKLNIL